MLLHQFHVKRFKLKPMAGLLSFLNCCGRGFRRGSDEPVYAVIEPIPVANAPRRVRIIDEPQGPHRPSGRPTPTAGILRHRSPSAPNNPPAPSNPVVTHTPRYQPAPPHAPAAPPAQPLSNSEGSSSLQQHSQAFNSNTRLPGASRDPDRPFSPSDWAATAGPRLPPGYRTPSAAAPTSVTQTQLPIPPPPASARNSPDASVWIDHAASGRPQTQSPPYSSFSIFNPPLGVDPSVNTPSWGNQPAHTPSSWEPQPRTPPADILPDWANSRPPGISRAEPAQSSRTSPMPNVAPVDSSNWRNLGVPRAEPAHSTRTSPRPTEPPVNHWTAGPPAGNVQGYSHPGIHPGPVGSMNNWNHLPHPDPDSQTRYGMSPVSSGRSPPRVNLPAAANRRPVQNTLPRRTDGAQFSAPPSRFSASPTSPGPPRRSAMRRRSGAAVRPAVAGQPQAHAHQHQHQCMLCEFCPQHQQLLNALVFRQQSPCAPQQWQSPASPKGANLPYTPAQLLCMTGIQPWMNSWVYVQQQPFY